MGEKIGKIIGKILAFFLSAWLVMLLWNSVVVPLLEVNGLRYWSSAGLILLCRMLTRHDFVIKND